jgi:putative transposase
MRSWIFSALLLTRITIVFLLSIPRMTVTLQIFTPAVGTVYRDRYHWIPFLVGFSFAASILAQHTLSYHYQQKNVDQVRVIPRKGFYIVEVIYTKEVKPAPLNPAYYAGIDIGMNNLVALTSNKPHFQAILVNGRPVKSINQFYNKRKAQLQKQLGHTGTTPRMERMTTKRNRRIDHYMHTASKVIIDVLVKEGIGVLCIGKNDGWKQEANMGKRTNQNFVQIPHARFIAMLTYKAQLVGIRVEVTEESYTSKASLLDLDPLPVRKSGDEKHHFSGKRVKRGLYRASNGRYINADINGAGNIIRKVAPHAFQQAEGVEDGKGLLASLVVHPVRTVIPV